MTKYSALLLLLVAVDACKTEAGPPAPSSDKGGETTAKLAGVWPKDFQCGSIAAPAALAELLGGELRQLENPASMPKGVAAPCMYEVTRDGAAEQWQFDFDCRDNYKKTFDTLLEQYRKQNTDMIADWNQKADAGVFKANDAGIVYNRPGDPIEVEVGAKALDHHGTALVFLDDDAPCYVRVAGKDATRRLELAKLVARNLTLMNAPMAPRAIK